MPKLKPIAPAPKPPAAAPAAEADTSAHVNSLTVNGRFRSVVGGRLTYEQALALAGLAMRPGLTVTYRNGPAGHATGTLAAGKSVAVADGMIVNVADTGDA